MTKPKKISIDSPQAYTNRELSWLSFARRVLALAEDPDLPLLERIKFAGIMGMLYDEFSMKRIGGLKRALAKKVSERTPDGRTPEEELQDCRQELRNQARTLARLVNDTLRPALASAGIPILEYTDLDCAQRALMRCYFHDSVEPILTPLAVDISHPFPFISNLGLNLAIWVTERKKKRSRFVRIKVPANRPRWVPVPGRDGYVPLEQVIADNLDLLFPTAKRIKCYFFRVIRGAKDSPWDDTDLDEKTAEWAPGCLIGMVTKELTARKFAGVVRLQVSADMPAKLQRWLAGQLKADPQDLESDRGLLRLTDLMKFQVDGYPELRDPPHTPVSHPRLRQLQAERPDAIFEEIRRGDILLHFPYHSFDNSILHFLQVAATDPKVLAIKITIYRTSHQSPIVEALIEATRRGKQVAVLMEITARFDEEPNIAWVERLEKEGVHVVYGMERLKTHVKLALVVREEEEGVRRYINFGSGNYHPGTARIYEDLSVLSYDQELGANAAAVFNELTGATPVPDYGRLMVAPHNLRQCFAALIRREAKHYKEGRPAGIRAKMNQLQDPGIIRELYLASKAGVPINLNVRGLCCLRAGVPSLSETIHVSSTLGRFLEHGRIYRFENAGAPEFFIGSADWMRRNLDSRMETIIPVLDPLLQKELEEILQVYDDDNCTTWDMRPNGSYKRRQPRNGEPLRPAQEVFIRLKSELDRLEPQTESNNNEEAAGNSMGGSDV